MNTYDGNGVPHDASSGQFVTRRLGEADPAQVLGGIGPSGASWRRLPDGSIEHTELDGTTWKQLTNGGIEYRDADGEYHRDAGWAVIWPDGSRFRFQHGVLHSDGDQPTVERADGTVEYMQDGLHHRVGGPAMIIPSTGQEIWYQHGLLHCDEGPAIRGSDGEATSADAYFYKGVFCPDRAAFDQMRAAEL